MIDEAGQPMDAHILAALPAGDPQRPVPTLWSYCVGETHGGSMFFLNDAGGLTAINAGEGIARIDTFQREPPAPSHDAFSAFQRESIQASLAEAGFYDGAVDGDLESTSEQAIRDWQASNGEEPTGILSWRQYLDLVFGG